MTETLQLPAPTWFVGCGNMGGAIVDGWRVGGHRSVAGHRHPPERRAGRGRAHGRPACAEAGPPPKLVVLAFKPQKLDEVAPRAAPVASAKTRRRVDARRRRGGEPARSAFRASARSSGRCRTCRSRSAAASPGSTARMPTSGAASSSANLFAALGFAMWMADEAKLAALGSVAGAGPGLCRAVHRRAGQGRRAARAERKRSPPTIALETVLGTAWMAATTGEDMESIARRVASPQRHDRGGPCGARPGHVLDELIAVDDRRRRAPRRRACRGGARPALACRGSAPALGASHLTDGTHG